MSSPADVRATMDRPLRLLAWIVVAAVFLVLGWAGARTWRGNGGDVAETVEARIDDLVLSVEMTGELAAVRATDIGPPVVKDIWDYKIAFLIDESSEVKKGQPIVTFDAQPLAKKLEEKEAEFAETVKLIEKREIELEISLQDSRMALSEAEARLSKAELKADVPDELKEGLEAEQARLELEATRKEVANLRGKLEAIREAGQADLRAYRGRRDRAAARVDELKVAIQAMNVPAPQDGIVIYKTNWRGEKKKVGDSTWSGEKLLQIPDLSEMKALAEVHEADAGRVEIGQPARLRLEAHPDVDFRGTVKRIGRTVSRKGWRDPNKIYKVEIALDETDPMRMRPAMRFRGEIETGRVPGLLLVPRESVFMRRSGPVVWVKRGRRFVETAAELGRSNDVFVEVVAGLEEGDLLSGRDLRPPEPKRVGAPLTAGL